MKTITHRLARAAELSKQFISSRRLSLQEETPEGDYRDTVINTTAERQEDKWHPLEGGVGARASQNPYTLDFRLLSANELLRHQYTVVTGIC